MNTVFVIAVILAVIPALFFLAAVTEMFWEEYGVKGLLIGPLVAIPILVLTAAWFEPGRWTP